MASWGEGFGKRLLETRGWRPGKGLGRREDGICEAVKVKLKCDNAGIGHHPGEQFSFHWWDHVFNTASAKMLVQTDQDKVQVKHLSQVEAPITNRKPRKAQFCHNLLYGRFIKAGTLPPSGEQEQESSDSDSDEDEHLDLSSVGRLTDEELVRVCGGRTAHKSARYGLTMNAKLTRLAEQERDFLLRTGSGPQTSPPPSPVEKPHSKKRKRKRVKGGEDEEARQAGDQEVILQEEPEFQQREEGVGVTSHTLSEPKQRKRKKRRKK